METARIVRYRGGGNVNLFDWFRRDGDTFDEPMGETEFKILLGTGLLLVLLAPAIGSVSSFWLDILIRMLIFALFALSLDLVFGYGGLLSLGHAAMFGTGGYVAALTLIHLQQNVVVVILVTFLSGIAVATLIGWLSVRSTGIYFAMLTLAFAQMIWIVAFFDVPARLTPASSITGGDNALSGIPDYTLGGFAFDGLIAYYYLTLLLVAVSVAAVIRVTNSPFGRAIQGIRENEERATFIGYNTTRYKLVVFALSGGFAAIAGALYAPFVGIADPGLLHWMTSSDVLVMVLIGGLGTLWGPMFGGAFLLLLEDRLVVIEGWEIIVGIIIVLLVLFAPNGLAGILSSVVEDPRGAVSRFKGTLTEYAHRFRE